MKTKMNYTYNLRNKKSVHNYIDNLFEQHAKILPVRVDLGYKCNDTISRLNKLPDGYHREHLNPHDYLTKEQIIENWDCLLDKLKWNHRVILKDLIGYIWKIEYGKDKGIHYHLMLLFNGNRVQKDFYYADMLGQLWLDITHKQGTYFNCSVDKTSRYGEYNCLKVLHRNDDRTVLYRTAKYLSKIDSNEKLARQFTRGRLFGRGN